MHAYLIRDAIERRMVEYDFLAGESQYKMSLATATRPLVNLRAVSSGSLEPLRTGTERAVERVKNWRNATSEAAVSQEQCIRESSSAQASKAAPRTRAVGVECVQSTYFPPEADRQLLGWYHPARRGDASALGVVVCAPLGYEGICAYPALRTMAERLAAAGHPALRFDYDGTGDSAGDDADSGRVLAWVKSVRDAVAELRRMSGVTEVCLFGVRMGASLAYLAAAEGGIDRVILWNACVAGKAFVREMKAFRMLAEQSGEIQSKPRSAGDLNDESGGFLFTAETLDSLKKVSLLESVEPPQSKVLLFGKDEVASSDELKWSEFLKSRGVDVSVRQM
jgi:pimeloyl-ACP methyl ester carboxylesterase